MNHGNRVPLMVETRNYIRPSQRSTSPALNNYKMTESEPSPPTLVRPILDLLESAGYNHAISDVIPDSDKLLHGVAWCISAAATSADHPFKLSICSDTSEDIEDALKSMGCPHALQATQIEDHDYVGMYPAVQWIVSCVKQRDSSYDNERKASVLTEMQLLKKRIEEAGICCKVQNLVSLLKQSKALERQGTEIQSDCNLKCFSLQSEFTKLEEDLKKGNGVEDPHSYFDCSISDLSKKLNFAKEELSSKLRELVSLKRQLDELPIEAELVQYERRFSELNVHIQDKLHQTRKYYETYNSLLEIKDLMLKETSLLNSVNSQFGDAIGNPAGRTTLVDSMEAILKGIQQKLEKVQLGLQVEQKTLDTLRERYSAAIMNQRHCSILLKDFQEECTKNERLKKEFALHKEQRGQTSP